MHILLLPRAYPNKINSKSGNFVRNQADALAKQSITIGVLGVFNVSLLALFQPKNISKLGHFSQKDGSINIMGFLYLVLPKLHYLNNRIKTIIAKRIFNQYIEKFGKPDLIHLHTFEMGLLALWAKEKYQIPFMVTEHTSSFVSNEAQKWHKKLAQKVYNSSIYNIGVSEISCKDLKERFGGEFHYIPNFVDTSRFSLKKKSIKTHTQFINVAYLNKVKNQKLLIESFFKAFGKDENFSLTIVGTGEEQKDLEALILLYETNNIHIHGYATQDELVELYHKSDYFVLSSKRETFGLVLIEAMSCGLPVISTKCGGPESIITNDKLGVLCSNNNIDALSDALRNASQTTYNSGYIRNYTIQNFSYESLSLKLKQVYSKILSR